MPIDHPTMRAHSYSLLRTIMGTALADELITRNPCTLRGAGSVKRASKTRPASLDELQVIRDTMPPRLACMIDLASWCGMRFGEIAELRRRDIDLRPGREVVGIERAVVSVGGERIVTSPKSDAGKRAVAIPPHVVGSISQHLDEHVGPDADALLFPAATGGHLSARGLYDHYYPARDAAGRKDLRFHDLRHTGAYLAAGTGATLADLMNRLGHSTVSAAMRYQHHTAERDRDVAARLSEAATGNVTSIDAARRRRA
jgi:integrase